MDVYDNYDDGEAETVPMTHEEYTDYKADCTAVLETADKAARLVENPDFVSVVMDGYLTEEPKRLALLMASGQLPPKAFDECVEDLRQIGGFKQYLSEQVQRGEIARNELKSLEEAYEASVLETEGGA